ncbi:hypothetical protein KY338_05230 [Candidatus Woesearchaeota archaeon]|nr:hypothetical protein [Candidatus Woesearchaeota archaeon]MBW3005553.1 hypothetical protein [Candidatus Woesearchaeota archaeon]
MGILTELGVSVLEPLRSIWNGIIQTVPGIVAAIILLIIGYIVALIIAYIVDQVLERIKFDKWVLDKTHAAKTFGKFRLGKFLALITKWYVFILFLPPAAALVRLGSLSNFLMAVAMWIPNVIVAVILAMIGVAFAFYIDNKITETKIKAASILAMIAKIIIYVFTLLIVLDQVGIQVAVAQTSFLIILAGVMLAVAMVIGIGFGLAFRDEAKGIIKQVKKKL